MVRHKKDNFSRGRKHATPSRRQHQSAPDEEEELEGGNRPGFKAACWDLDHCDPKRCSGKRLVKMGLMRSLHIGQKHSGVVISYETAELALKD
jgi:pre-rRNA-processing protein TSR3